MLPETGTWNSIPAKPPGVYLSSIFLRSAALPHWSALLKSPRLRTNLGGRGMCECERGRQLKYRAASKPRLKESSLYAAVKMCLPSRRKAQAARCIDTVVVGTNADG